MLFKTFVNKMQLLSLLLMVVLAVQYVSGGKSNPCSVDAAVTYAKNDMIFFFKGDKYAYYDDSDSSNRRLSRIYCKCGNL